MFVGTTGGGIFRSRDGGVTWSQTLSSIDIPSRAITSIQTHPKSAATVVVTVASSGILSSGVQLATGANLPYRHVFRSEDMGDTWKDIDAGHLSAGQSFEHQRGHEAVSKQGEFFSFGFHEKTIRGIRALARCKCCVGAVRWMATCCASPCSLKTSTVLSQRAW